ncbi:aldolase citrate lyase family protein [Moniliophthora roreri MCA 2997]|uniref:Aldolase citrate lyase family protein n=1 Tax=Moniliophthora roreri (strain MCA 2997) TaxID=1381753 RepID=V2Y379_MONRO|nr:aldolase citrate lyase family protein [Moniliophthora roreri MCA 2997]KAI3616653.1 aldolase citrate lyase family protein [Moniliophthora roreri]
MRSFSSQKSLSRIASSEIRGFSSRPVFFSSTNPKVTYDLRVPRKIKWRAHEASFSTMSANSLLDAFKAKRPAFGTFITSGGFFFARAVAKASPHMEWICIDCEHGLMSLNPGVSELIAAIQATGIPAFVRIPATGVSMGTSWQIKYALDAGAKGIVVPMVSTAEKAREVVSDSRFPPVGRRGFGSSYTHGNWNMSAQDYLDIANDNVIVTVQIETKEAIENLEEIAAVDGVDVLLLGPSDLSMAYGYPVPSPDPHPEIEKLIQKVLRVAHEKGKKCAMYVNNGEKAAQRAKEGFDMVSVTNDIGNLTLGISAQFDDAVRLSK